MRMPYNLYRVCLQIFTMLYIQGTQGLELLDSLRCVNDFKTHWKCQWKNMTEVQDVLPMSLYHWNNLGSFRHRCIPGDSKDQVDGKGHVSCRFNDMFSSSVTTSFTFMPEQDVNSETCIIPASKVRMLPPKDLKVQMTNNSKISLTWKMPKNVHSLPSHLYQVKYCRKDWEKWEDAVFINVLGKMEAIFSLRSFVPGSTYLFKVRSVAQEDPAYRSVWSEELSWVMPADLGTIIQNLNCEYDGSLEMRCSWEVRRELIRSLSFILYYTESHTDCNNSSSKSSVPPNGKKACVGEKNAIKDSVPYVQYRCSLQIPSSQANHFFCIQVRNQEEVKNLKACKNIQTEAPTDLQIKTESKNGYTLKWSPPEVDFSTIQLTYQLCYWTEEESECPEYSLVNGSGNPPEYYFSVSKLEGSTFYTAKVRAKPDEKSLYNGPWSEWSQSLSWKTTIVLTTEVICISVFIISVAVSLFAFFAFRYYKRIKQKLDDSLPNPSKSKLLCSHSLGYWKQSFYPSIQEGFYTEEEKASICVPIGPANSHVDCDATEDVMTEKVPNPGVFLLKPDSLPKPAEEKIIPVQRKDEFLGTGDKSNITSVPTPDIIKDLSNKSSNRPYLMFTGPQSMSNLVSNEAKRPGYFSLPRCQTEVFNVPKETTHSLQPQKPGDQMDYVIGMENMLSVHPMQNGVKKCAPDKYFAVPASSDLQVLPVGPLMIINPDGSGSLLLKQVGDYCFFPGFCGSQESLERKITPVSEQNQQNASEGPPLSALMQRGYIALPPT